MVRILSHSWGTARFDTVFPPQLRHGPTEEDMLYTWTTQAPSEFSASPRQPLWNTRPSPMYSTSSLLPDRSSPIQIPQARPSASPSLTDHWGQLGPYGSLTSQPFIMDHFPQDTQLGSGISSFQGSSLLSPTTPSSDPSLSPLSSYSPSQLPTAPTTPMTPSQKFGHSPTSSLEGSGLLVLNQAQADSSDVRVSIKIEARSDPPSFFSLTSCNTPTENSLRSFEMRWIYLTTALARLCLNKCISPTQRAIGNATLKRCSSKPLSTSILQKILLSSGSPSKTPYTHEPKNWLIVIKSFSKGAVPACPLDLRYATQTLSRTWPAF